MKHKTKGHNRIRTEVNNGTRPKASKLPCVDCGKRALEYDHFLGYGEENLSTVQPVCHSCHMKRTWKRGENTGSRGHAYTYVTVENLLGRRRRRRVSFIASF